MLQAQPSLEPLPDQDCEWNVYPFDSGPLLTDVPTGRTTLPSSLTGRLATSLSWVPRGPSSPFRRDYTTSRPLPGAPVSVSGTPCRTSRGDPGRPLDPSVGVETWGVSRGPPGRRVGFGFQGRHRTSYLYLGGKLVKVAPP